MTKTEVQGVQRIYSLFVFLITSFTVDGLRCSSFNGYTPPERTPFESRKLELSILHVLLTFFLFEFLFFKIIFYAPSPAPSCAFSRNFRLFEHSFIAKFKYFSIFRILFGKKSVEVKNNGKKIFYIRNRKIKVTPKLLSPSFFPFSNYRYPGQNFHFLGKKLSAFRILNSSCLIRRNKKMYWQTAKKIDYFRKN